MIPCSSFQGGEVWVQNPEGKTTLSGILWDVHTPLRFDPKNLHATAPWGGDRMVLIGFHVRHMQKLPVEDAELLRQLGFKLDLSLA